MIDTLPNLRKTDWIRFQLLHQKTVLEGFIQETSPDGNWIKVGNAPDSPETLWYARSSIEVLDHQELGAPV